MKLRKYSLEFKLKCLEIEKKFGIYIYTGIDKNCIRHWKINKQKFQNIKNKKNTFRFSNSRSIQKIWT